MIYNQQQTPINSDVERVVKAILKEDAKYALHEMRSVHRENLVVPVTMIYPDKSRADAVSRNISPAGICLISSIPLESDQILDLEIYRLQGACSVLSAEIRWCKPFGETYFMSGWKFLRVRK